MKSRIILCGLFFICTTLFFESSSTASQKIGRIYELYHGNISVSAKLLEAIESPDDPPFYRFLLIIEDAHRRYEVKSDIILSENFNEALSVLKNNISSKDGYTFIRHECGGGNGWRCNIDSIFTVKKGVLQRIGDMAGGEERGAVGQNYADGLFADVYDKFEMNALTSHAAAPYVEIYSRDNKGTLKVDLDVTWKRNLDGYQKNNAVIDRILKESVASEEDADELLSALLQKAVATKYCNRMKEAEEAMQIADRSFTKDMVNEFHAIVKNVISGELSKTRVKQTR